MPAAILCTRLVECSFVKTQGFFESRLSRFLSFVLNYFKPRDNEMNTNREYCSLELMWNSWMSKMNAQIICPLHVLNKANASFEFVDVD